jgi:hypothetical protein
MEPHSPDIQRDGRCLSVLLLCFLVRGIQWEEKLHVITLIKVSRIRIDMREGRTFSEVDVDVFSMAVRLLSGISQRL